MSELIHIKFWGRLTDQFGRERTVDASGVDTIESLIASLGEAVSDGSIRVILNDTHITCLLYTSPSPRDATLSRMPSSA